MNYLLIVLQIANFSQITHSPTLEELSHTKMKNCEYLRKAISSPLMLGGRYTPRQWSCQKFLFPQKLWPF